MMISETERQLLIGEVGEPLSLSEPQLTHV